MPIYRWADHGRKPAKSADMLTNWAGGTLARAHALGPKIRAIAEHQARNEITSISIRGREGTGKTTLARVLAHMLHAELDRHAHGTAECSPHEKKHRAAMKRGYVVRVLNAEHLRELTRTMEALPAGINRICIFDDSSFMGASASRIVQKIKHELTQIRHTAAGDVKCILIYNFHYSKALDPYLRDTNFIFQTSISGPEMHNVRELYEEPTGQNMWTLGQFQSASQSLQRRGQATLTLGGARRPGHYKTGRTKITYRYSDPFRLATFFDGSRLSLAVYPAADADGSDALSVCACGICAAAAATAGQPGGGARIDATQVVEWLRKQWASPDLVGAALRGIYLRRHGRDPIHRDRNVAMEIITRLESSGVCKYEDLVRAYFGDGAAAEHILGGGGRRPSVPAGKRNAFLHVFKIDALRRPDEPARKAPTAEDVEAAQAEMR